MMKSIRMVILGVLIAGAATLNAQTASEREALLAGDAMGQAAAAELNGYPSPKRVMEFAKELKLTAAQVAAVDAIARDLRTRATDLGKRIAGVEDELNDAFRSGLVSEKSIQETTDQIAKLRGKLRALHLTAALRTKAALTAEQLKAYAALKSPKGGAKK